MSIETGQPQAGSTIVLVHHTGKDASKGARGSGALRAATDTEIELLPDLIAVTKQRSISSKWRSPFTLLPIELGTDEDGDPIVNATVQLGTAVAGFDDETPAPAIKLSRKEQAVLTALGDMCATESDPAQLADIARVLFGDKTDKDNIDATRKQLFALLGKGCVARVAKGKWAPKGADKVSAEAARSLADIFG